MLAVDLIEALEELPQEIRTPLLKVLKSLEKAIGESVRREDFRELKAVVASLAEAQKRTEERLNELAEAQKRTEERLDRLEQVVTELAEAQKRTEKRLNELAEAQKRTEERLDRLEQVVTELAEAQKRTEQEIAKLARGLQRTRKELGGLSRSVAYALENEAYRHLPSLLRERYGIEITRRFIRTYMDGEEIDLFARARKGEKDLHLVGEAVLKLDDTAKLRQVWKKAQLVKEEKGGEVIPIIVTHFARPDVLERAEKSGIIVIQSFEWG